MSAMLQPPLPAGPDDDALPAGGVLQTARILDMLLDPVCIVDRDGCFLYVNAAYERVLGYPRESLLGQPMIELVHPDDRDRTLAAAAEIIGGCAKLHFRNRYLRRDGRVVHLMWSARWSAADRARIAVARDVSSLVRAEQLRETVFAISEAAHRMQPLNLLFARVRDVLAERLGLQALAIALPAEDGRLLLRHGIGPCGALSPAVRQVLQPWCERIGSGDAATGTLDDPDPRFHWLGCRMPLSDTHAGVVAVRADGHGEHAADHGELLHYLAEQIGTAWRRVQHDCELQAAALHDPLTGLPNRLLLAERIGALIAASARSGAGIGVLFIDLDGFKPINDRHGHLVGDALLVDVARTLSGCVRASDTVARVGGDEFVVVLADLDRSDRGQRVIEAIGRALAVPVPSIVGPLAISASIGSARFPDDGRTPFELIGTADRRMYRAKQQRGA